MQIYQWTPLKKKTYLSGSFLAHTRVKVCLPSQETEHSVQQLKSAEKNILIIHPRTASNVTFTDYRNVY